MAIRRRRRTKRLNLDKRGETIRVVLLEIARQRVARREPMPSFARLVKLLGVPNRRAVVYHTRKLAQRGFVSRLDRGADPMVLKIRRGL
jgi:hypothetical protein